MLICFFIWYILYYILGLANWNEERKQLQFCITTKTMQRGTSFLLFLPFFFYAFAFFCVYSWFSFLLFLFPSPPATKCVLWLWCPISFFVQSPFSLFPSPQFSSVNFRGKKKAFAMVLIPYWMLFLFFGFGIGLDWLERQKKKKSKKAKKNQLQNIHSLFHFYSIYTPTMHVYVSNIQCMDDWFLVGLGLGCK